MIKTLLENPIIASVKSDEALEEALKSSCKIIFILYGNICNIKTITQKILDANKQAFVHIDLIEGLASSDIAVKFIANEVKPTGIISTKSFLVKEARTLGIKAILRTFIVDSFSYHNLPKQVQLCDPDAVEILPGVLFSGISYLTSEIKKPLIAGGLVCEDHLVISALNSGAYSISTTNVDVWKLIDKLAFDKDSKAYLKD